MPATVPKHLFAHLSPTLVSSSSARQSSNALKPSSAVPSKWLGYSCPASCPSEGKMQWTGCWAGVPQPLGWHGYAMPTELGFRTLGGGVSRADEEAARWAEVGIIRDCSPPPSPAPWSTEARIRFPKVAIAPQTEGLETCLFKQT